MKNFILSAQHFFTNDRTEKLLFILFCVFIWLAAVSNILYKPAWLIGDEVENIRTTARGIPEPLSAHSAVTAGNSNARFYPLGHYDLNLLTFIPGAVTPKAHYIFISFSFTASFLLLSCFLVYYAKKNNKAFPFYRTAAVLFFFFFTPGVIAVYFKLVYPERILIFLLSAFFLFYLKALESGRVYYYAAAFLSAACSCYVKEPVFGLFIVFSALNLYFVREKLDKRQRLFHYAVIANSLFYICVYYFFVWRNRTSVYAGFGDNGFFENIFSLLCNSPVIIYPLILFAAESIKNIKKLVDGKEFSPVPFFSYSMLSAGMAYAAAVLLLRLNSGYYLVPPLAASLPAAAAIKPCLSKSKYFCIIAALFLWCVNESHFVVHSMHKDRAASSRITGFINNAAINGGSLYLVVPPHKKTVQNAHMLNFPGIYSEFAEFYTGKNLNCRIVAEDYMLENDIGGYDIVVFAAMRGNGGLPVLPSGELENMLEKKGFEFQLHYADQLFFIHRDNVKKSAASVL